MPGRGWKHLQLAGIGFADTYRGEFRTWKYLQFAGIGLVDTYRGDFRMWKYLQFADIGFADAYHQVDIKNPTTIAVGLFFMSKKEQNVLVDLRSILC